MKLKAEEEKLLKQFIASVDSVVARFVPSPVPGMSLYNQMMTYQDLRNKVGSFLFPSTEKKSKWKQIDLEEAIKNEKQRK